MLSPNPAALDFLLARRSFPARTLTTPVPDDALLRTILTAATRTPDHGKLEPWRLVVLTRPALTRIAGQVAARADALAIDPDRKAKTHAQYADAHLAVLVVAVSRASEKVPAIEQTYSAGAVCLGLVNATLAAGFGANWLSGWPLYDADLLTTAFGLAPGETAAGIIHIGTVTQIPPDRPRPDLDRVTTWVTA